MAISSTLVLATIFTFYFVSTSIALEARDKLSLIDSLITVSERNDCEELFSETDRSMSFKPDGKCRESSIRILQQINKLNEDIGLHAAYQNQSFDEKSGKGLLGGHGHKYAHLWIVVTKRDETWAVTSITKCK